MKRFILFLIVLAGINIYAVKYFPGDWQIYSYMMSVQDIDGNLNEVYAASNAGIIVIDKFTGQARPLLAFRNNIMNDFPFSNLMVDDYRMYHIYFSGRKNFYHYDKFADSLYMSDIPGYRGSSIERIGVDPQYVYIEIRDKVLQCRKDSIAFNNWNETDNVNIKWKYDSKDIESRIELMPRYRYFLDRKYEFTCYYENMGYYWVGTDGAGIFKIDINTKEEEHYLKSTGSLDNRAIAVDSIGSIWIAGMRTQFITRYFPEGDSFRYFPARDIPQITDNNIISISCSQDNILFGTNTGEAFFYSLSDKRFYEIFNEQGNTVFRSAPISGSRFFISDNMGVGIIDTEIKRFSRSSIEKMPSVIDLNVYNDSLFIVSGNSVYSMHKDGSEFTGKEFDFPVFTVYQYIKNDSIEIIADNAYLHVKTGGDSSFASYPVEGFFGEFWDMTYDSDNIWIAGRDGVARFFRKDKRWKVYSELNTPMPRTFTYSLISLGGYIYAGTGNAFFKFYYSNPMLINE
ncbi:MAG: hypothetical protein SVK54_08360 [candidate division WOR-3 bacterium]|nr:hypothetical protein [candidate division WOR-3 bacterium]